MGYAFATGHCLRCRRVFTFNPVRVPSVRYPPPDGPREPICRDCFETLQGIREEHGLPRLPLAPDAYEAVSEEELP